MTETLLRHPGQVLSREQLLDQVWGLNFDPGSNIVGPSVVKIETVRGMGYRLTDT